MVSVDQTLALASLVGDRVLVIHGPSPEEVDRGLSGRDVDCAVAGLDAMWPLRLPDGWRFCGSIRYDLRGWYWVLERAGQVIALDTIEDPLGLGRDALRTELFIAEGGEAPAFVRAAYLTVKRLRKGIDSDIEWERIAQLAADDPAAYERTLEMIVGSRFSRRVADRALVGQPPDAATFRRVERHLRVRRFGSPTRLAISAVLGARRYAERVLQPAGLVVLIGGPDGAGKSSLADGLPQACEGIFKRGATSFHWRPGVLPRLGSFVGRQVADASEPHAQTMHGKILSVAVLAYYSLDFLVGELARIVPLRIRAGLVVAERGWWDMAVDPRRYRLDLSEGFVRASGMFAPHYDLALVLEADPGTLLSRKQEISTHELVTQTAAWRRVLPKTMAKEYLDASRPQVEVVEVARTKILDVMERRALSRLGAGWALLPPFGTPRWWIPRGPAVATTTSLAIYQPTSPRTRAAWEVAQRCSRFGTFRLLPRASAPPSDVLRKLAKHLPPRSTFSLAKANHPFRFTALIVDDRGHARGVAKVATDEAGTDTLAREAAAIRALGPRLSGPLSAPLIIAEDRGLLILDAVSWEPRARPWELTVDIATAVGEFFRSGASGAESSLLGPAHGDLAPWNLLQTADGGAVLVDWESAATNLPVFHDVCHWLVQSHALLGSPSRQELVQGLRRGEGWIGAAVGAYASGAGVASSHVISAMVAYLQSSEPTRPANNRREQDAVSARRLLLRELEG